MMRITDVETFQLTSPLDRTFGWSQDWIQSRSVGLVKVSTDEGIVGWGEGSKGPAADTIHKVLAPIITGSDPTNRIGLWQKMFHALYNANVAVGLGGCAISAIDTAFWT